jgi:hypothetical protein
VRERMRCWRGSEARSGGVRGVMGFSLKRHKNRKGNELKLTLAHDEMKRNITAVVVYNTLSLSHFIHKTAVPLKRQYWGCSLSLCCCIFSDTLWSSVGAKLECR